MTLAGMLGLMNLKKKNNFFQIVLYHVTIHQRVIIMQVFFQYTCIV